MQNSNRNLYIDVMKGLLIILVVIGHLPFFEYDSRTLTLIYSFHMHAFLIIGGMLSHVNENTKLLTIIIKRIKNTLIPYFLFYLISFILVPTTMEQKIEALYVVIKGIGIPPDKAINLPLWFLTFYFVAMTTFEIIEWLSYKIKKLLTNNTAYYLIAIFDLIIILPLMNFTYTYARIYKKPRLPFNIEIALFCLLFVFFGKILSVYIKSAFTEISKNTKLKIWTILFLTIALIVFTYCWYKISMHNGRIDLNARDYKNSRLMYVAATLGFIIFGIISYVISLIPHLNTFLATLGMNSIYILAYHIPSTAYTYPYIISRLPAIIGTTLSKNSPYSIALLTSFGIWFSLIMALIHNACRSLIQKLYKVRNDNYNY